MRLSKKAKYQIILKNYECFLDSHNSYMRIKNLYVFNSDMNLFCKNKLALFSYISVLSKTDEFIFEYHRKEMKQSAKNFIYKNSNLYFKILDNLENILKEIVSNFEKRFNLKIQRNFKSSDIDSYFLDDIDLDTAIFNQYFFSGLDNDSKINKMIQRYEKRVPYIYQKPAIKIRKRKGKGK